MRTLSLVFAILAAASLPVRADDSTAELVAGGLVLEKTDTVALVAEDLYLSEKAVRIDDRFCNRTDADVETHIVFSMPDITGDLDRHGSIPDPAHDNFLRFTIEVDGQSVTPEIEQRAFLLRNGKAPVEISERLRAVSIPLVPTVEATEEALRRLGENQRLALIQAGILERQVHKDGTIADVPLWTLKSKFWRRQVFPAGREIAIRTSYVPSLGGLSSLSYGSPDLDPPRKAQYVNRYCTEPAFEKAAQALYRRASADGSRSFQAYERYLTYGITSGGNGAGPIGTFRLVVDKGDPATQVAFCAANLKKIGPTTFETVVKDYVPKRDIDILFLKTGTGD